MSPGQVIRGLLACSPLLYALVMPPALAAAAPAPLTLQDALERTRASHPALAASRHDVAAARSLVREAGRRPAPSFAAEYENFGGDVGGGLADVTLTAEQTFELGGDRGARRGVSAAQAAIAAAGHGQLRQDVEAATVEAFAEAWAAQERAARWREAVREAAAAVTAAAERLRQGAAPAHEVARARANHALRRIELEREERLLATARERLAAQGLGAADSVGALVLADPLTLVPAEWSALADADARQPGARRARAELERDAGQSRWVRAQRTPDVTLGAGARRFAEPAATGFVMSVTLALPGPGSGPDALAAAAEARAASAGRADAERARRLAHLRGVHDRLAGALASYRELSEQVLPAAEEAVRGLTSAFRAGGLTYLEVLEGQRARLEAHALGIELTREAWVANMELERWMTATAGEEAR